MVLSRIWYAILAFLLAGAYYSVSLGVGQYNRRNAQAMDETLKADSQVVGWSLQVDARRRLDSLLLASVDQGVVKALKAANGQLNGVPSSAKEEGRKALSAYNEKVRAEYKGDAVFAVDREGRLVAQVGYDAAQKNPEFELGGYPAVFDALHGYLRDDTWVLGGRIARVVARPVEDDVGQPPLGAVVAIKWVDQAFAKDVAKRTRANVAFFVGSQVTAVASSTDGIDDTSLQLISDDIAKVLPDQGFQDSGRSDVRALTGQTQGASIMVKLPGDSWKLNGGFAVVRPKVAISSALGFLSGADDTDKKNVSFVLMFLILLGGGAVGFGLSFLEHTRPMNEMTKQANQLKSGGIDALQVARFRGGYRAIAQAINTGIERVVEKGGGAARKPADLQAILGPVPAQPAMSAFSFPQGPAGAAPPSAPSSRSALPRPPVPNLSGPPTSPPFTQKEHNDEADTLAGSGNAGNAMKAISGGIPGMQSPKATTLNQPATPVDEDDEDEDVATKVAQAPSEIAGAHDPEMAEWVGVYDDFIQTKRRCGEPTDSLTFEKFQQTLRKNRDALIERHGCKRVKFTVYVKDGRASLKATPVRE